MLKNSRKNSQNHNIQSLNMDKTLSKQCNHSNIYKLLYKLGRTKKRAIYGHCPVTSIGRIPIHKNSGNVVAFGYLWLLIYVETVCTPKFQMNI